MAYREFASRRGLRGVAVVGVSVVGLVSACSAPPTAEQAAQEQQAIHGFGNNPTPDELFPAVGQYAPALLSTNCTATLVSPSVVMVAAHCVSPWAQNCRSVTSDSGTLGDVTIAPDPNGVPKGYIVDSIAVAPGAYNQRIGDCDKLANNTARCTAETALPEPGSTGLQVGFDVALLHLAQPVNNVTPMRVLTSLLDSAPFPYSMHLPVTLTAQYAKTPPLVPIMVGWGASDSPNSTRLAGAGVFRLVGPFWDRQCTAAFNCSGVPDTHPKGSCATGQYEEGVLTLGRTSIDMPFDGPIVGPGDSGSPLVVVGGTEPGKLPGLTEGQFLVVGVASQGPQIGFGQTVPPGDLTMQYAATYSPEIGPWIDDRLSDFDGDGVIDTQDNCPITWNKQQENCNKTSELARFAQTNQPPQGDVCDPVPCPGATANVITSTTDTTFASANSTLFESERDIFNEIDFATVGSSPLVPVGGFQLSQPTFDSASNVSLPVAGIDTAFRYCQQAPLQGFDCLSPASVRDALLDPGETAAQETLSPARPWHRVTVGAFATRGADTTLNYGTSNPSTTWDYAGDNTFWHRNPGSPVIPQPDVGQYDACSQAGAPAGTCLDGAFWLHGNTDIGNGTTVVGGVTVGSHGAELANHHYTTRPDSIVTRALIVMAPVIEGPVRYVPAGDPAPFWAAAIGERNRVLPLLVQGPSTYVFTPRGGFDVTPFMSARFRATIAATTTRWINAAESTPFVGRTSATAVLLSVDATRVLDTAIAGGNGISLGSEASGGAGLASSPVTPVARTGFQAVFSRVENTVYVVGGTATSNGAILGDVWAQPLGLPWRQIPLVGGPLGQVLAAGYELNDAHLWLVDHALVSSIDMLRLVRVDPHAGTVEVLAQTPRLGNADRFWLTTDRDGSLLYAASNAILNSHLIAKISLVGPKLRTSVEEFLPGQLGLGPIADSVGYTLPLLDVLGNVTMVHRDSLEATTSWCDLVLSAILD